MRAPNSRRFLFVVCVSINAVISTAWAWCMIIPCMNSTSFFERGGKVALVDGGSIRDGWPGAPGWTITSGGVESACCAQTVIDKKHTKTLAARNALRDSVTIANIFT